MPIMARLGVGLLVIPQKPWDDVGRDFEVYHQVWGAENPAVPPPKPLTAGFFVVDCERGSGPELARRYIGGYYASVMKHYEMTAGHFAGINGYEFYSNVTKYIDRHGERARSKASSTSCPGALPTKCLRSWSGYGT